jgi:protein dithiol oxidoreductase (disulfide-forming)
MLKQMVCIGFFSVVSLFSTPSLAIEFEQGKHFAVVGEQASETPKVSEYFSFYCPHCYRFEPIIDAMHAALPAGTTFVKNHVDSLPGHNPEIEHMLTKALFSAEMLHVEKTMIPAIFKYIHVNKADFSSQQDLKNLFVINDVDGEAFDKTMSSFAVNAQFNKAQRSTAALRAAGIHTVPTVIVNDKYQVIANSITSTDEYISLVLYLLNKTEA